MVRKQAIQDWEGASTLCRCQKYCPRGRGHDDTAKAADDILDGKEKHELWDERWHGRVDRGLNCRANWVAESLDTKAQAFEPQRRLKKCL